MTSKVEPLPANSPIGVTGVTVMDVVVQKGNPEALSSSLCSLQQRQMTDREFASRSLAASLIAPLSHAVVCHLRLNNIHTLPQVPVEQNVYCRETQPLAKCGWTPPNYTHTHAQTHYHIPRGCHLLARLREV